MMILDSDVSFSILVSLECIELAKHFTLEGDISASMILLLSVE